MMTLAVIGAVLIALISVFILKRASLQKDSANQIAIAAVAMLLLCIGLECTVFNCNYFATRKNVPIVLGGVLFDAETDENGYIIDSNNKELDIDTLGASLDNLYIDLSENGNPSTVGVTVALTDEANALLYSVPKRTLATEVEDSQYINLHTAGKSEKIRLSFDIGVNESITLSGIWANAQRPFDFSPLRLIILFCILMLLWLFRPKSFIYSRRCDESKELCHSLTGAFLCLQCAVIIILGTINPTFMGIASKSYNTYKWDGSGIDFTQLSMPNHNQYDELASAILQGKLYIDNNDVPQSLINMDNPYDTAARSAVASITGDSYRWDVAYYNSHYYVYFGIVPELLMYLPFRAVFDAPFPTAVGIMAFCLLFGIGIFLLIKKLVDRFYPGTSVGVFLLLALVSINASGAIFLCKRPDFYSLPIICGMTFTVFGLYFWLTALDGRNKKRGLLFLGALCMALVAGCRPQLLLLSALALPLFFSYFFKDKYILKKDGLFDLAVLAVPYIVAAAGIMSYNYLRFASPFDFGSSYNLTTNDVTNRGFELGRIGLGIFTYLFQPPVFTAKFPYLSMVKIDTVYAGKTIFENCFGGLFAVAPTLWFLFATGSVKGKLKENKLRAFTLLLIALGTGLVIADTQAGGLLQRYFSDFGFVFFLAAVIVILSLVSGCESEKERHRLNTLIFLSVIFSIFYSVLLAISVSDVTIDKQNPTLFEALLHGVEFWM